MGIPSLMMTGKVVLITGGRRGLGRAFALAFAEAGADIAICDYMDKGGELDGVVAEVRKSGRRALAIKADVSRKADVENMVNKTVAELENIDILINNAGIIVRRPFLEVEEDDWDRVINSNLKGTFLCSQAVSRLMIERNKGNIINIASINGLWGWPGRISYNVSKAGVIMLTRVLARELGPHNIRVNAIAPGDTKTPMNEALFIDPEFKREYLPRFALGRVGETDDTVGVALFLASDAASWITGHTLVVDGGFLA